MAFGFWWLLAFGGFWLSVAFGFVGFRLLWLLLFGGFWLLVEFCFRWLLAFGGFWDIGRRILFSREDTLHRAGHSMQTFPYHKPLLWAQVLGPWDLGDH